MEKKCSKVCIREYAKMGFKFEPTAQQICETYLKLKIEGKKLPCQHMIADENMYEDYSTPWEVLKTDDPRWLTSTESSSNNRRKTKKVIYVFTMLRKKGERVLRKAGCGTWTGQNKKAVENEGGDALIGYDRLLTFKIAEEKKKSDDHGNWTMHEYTLHPNDYNCAVCRITKEEDVLDKFVASKSHHSMVDASVINEQPSMHNYEEFSSIINNGDIDHVALEGFSSIINNGDLDVALEGVSHQNMHQEDLLQEQPLLEQEWGSFTETLEKILEQEEESEACDKNIIEAQFPIEVNDALADEDVINVIAQNKTDKLHSDVASDPPFKPCKDYEEPRNMIGQSQQEPRDMICLVPNDNQVFLVEQELQPQQTESMALIGHLAENFDYYYQQQQQQQLEGGQNSSLGKRKNSDHHEEDLCSDKKQQQSFLCSRH